MYATQYMPVATPRGFVTASVFIPSVRTKLVRSFYKAFPQAELSSVRQIESALLSNGCAGDQSLLSLLLIYLESSGLDSITPEKSKFFASIIAYCPSSEDHRLLKIRIRDLCLHHLLTLEPNCSSLLPLVDIVVSTPTEGIGSVQVCKWVCDALASMYSIQRLSLIQLVKRIVRECSDQDLLVIQRSQTSSNILLALATLVTFVDNGRGIVVETEAESSVRTEALHAISSALVATSDPVGLLNLRRDADDQTIGQKAFMVMFQELFHEVESRRGGITDDAHSYSLELRLKRLKIAVGMVLRLAALHVEAGQATPLDEYALLIPSLFGLVKGILATAKEPSNQFDIAVRQLLTGDLLYVKELGLPELVGSCFEIETAVIANSS